jgi:hypothetical protein
MASRESERGESVHRGRKPPACSALPDPVRTISAMARSIKRDTKHQKRASGLSENHRGRARAQLHEGGRKTRRVISGATQRATRIARPRAAAFVRLADLAAIEPVSTDFEPSLSCPNTDIENWRPETRARNSPSCAENRRNCAERLRGVSLSRGNVASIRASRTCPSVSSAAVLNWTLPQRLVVSTFVLQKGGPWTTWTPMRQQDHPEREQQRRHHLAGDHE